VLVVSARGDDANKIRGLGMGADDYLAKPFSPAELVARVKAHLSRYRRLTGTDDAATLREVTVGPLSLDAERRLIRLRGDTLALTAKEHEMLTLLLQNPGRLFSKEELYERVWGENNAGDQSTVATHIRRLREKIEADPADPSLILTVWGLGYRLADTFKP
jgi:DNA-binding response OmpR family regulator